MDQPPSFRRRADVWRLLLALAVPWLLIALAYSGPLLARAVGRAGHDTSWMGGAPLVWFLAFGFPGLLSLPAFFLLGVYRLAVRREVRRSWYGWLWLVWMWLNAGALSTVVQSKAVMMM